jgi:hypothetical protein
MFSAVSWRCDGMTRGFDRRTRRASLIDDEPAGVRHLPVLETSAYGRDPSARRGRDRRVAERLIHRRHPRLTECHRRSARIASAPIRASVATLSGRLQQKESHRDGVQAPRERLAHGSSPA